MQIEEMYRNKPLVPGDDAKTYAWRKAISEVGSSLLARAVVDEGSYRIGLKSRDYFTFSRAKIAANGFVSIFTDDGVLDVALNAIDWVRDETIRPNDTVVWSPVPKEAS